PPRRSQGPVDARRPPAGASSTRRAAGAGRSCRPRRAAGRPVTAHDAGDLLEVEEAGEPVQPHAPQCGGPPDGPGDLAHDPGHRGEEEQRERVHEAERPGLARHVDRQLGVAVPQEHGDGPGEDDLPRDDDDDEPPRHELAVGEADEGDEDVEAVGRRVEHPAQAAHLVEAPGDESVEPVGGTRDREDDEGGGVVLADDEPGEDGHEREPQEADDVRDGPDALVGGGARRLVPGVHEDQRTQAGAAPAAGRARRDRAVTCPYAHRMRFGMFIPQGWRFDLVGIEDARQWPLMRDLARRAEAGPWESVWVYDHFHTTPVPSEEATHEAWSLMAALAASTERVRLGQMCTCMAYRPPMYLAKTAATIDHVSGGRLEMGIGAGWYEHEWRAYGYGFP